jgi:hypothetical protein
MERWNVQELQAYAGDVGIRDTPYRWRRPDAKEVDMMGDEGITPLVRSYVFQLGSR